MSFKTNFNFKINPEKSIKYKYSHSSGPGGQNVNKRNTTVNLLFDLSKSNFNEDERKKFMIFLNSI